MQRTFINSSYLKTQNHSSALSYASLPTFKSLNPTSLQVIEDVKVKIRKVIRDKKYFIIRSFLFGIMI